MRSTACFTAAAEARGDAETGQVSQVRQKGGADPAPPFFMGCSVLDPGHPLSEEEWYDTSTVTGKKTTEERSGTAPYQFPHIVVLKASAGSGKTHELTLRYVQFALSDSAVIPRNGLRNILAITFSNNAAKEMKERVLRWLKDACIGDEESLAQLSAKLNLEAAEVRKRAAGLLEHILDNYADFQVRTIDSFMTTVFKSSAIDFGYNPDFEIIMDSGPVLEYSFDLFLRRVREGSKEAGLLASVIAYIGEHKDGDAAYLWDPSAALLDEVKVIYRKLSATQLQPLIEDLSPRMAALKSMISAEISTIDALVMNAGLRKNGNSSFAKTNLLKLVTEGRHRELLGKTFALPPVSSLKKGEEALIPAHDEVLRRWESFKGLVRAYAGCFARSFYAPYLGVYQGFRETIEMVKRHQEKVFIGDISSTLAGYIAEDSVPDIYFRIGETIYHYLIDEFQDTSPVQWDDLLPLIDNSLSQGGSLYVVGDTKQAIYGFRNADYTIMQGVAQGKYFSSVSPVIEELDTNYRSLGSVLAFNEKVFRENVKEHPEYSGYAGLSGLTGYEQKVKPGRIDPGHVECVVLERNDEDPPEREKIRALIADLCSRGFRLSDIAILTLRNEDAVRVSGWLNEKGLAFISYSNLDIRRRKITGEIISLLNFLDSPVDDHSFAAFLLGDIFERFLEQRGGELTREDLRSFIFSLPKSEPLYKSFQARYEQAWAQCFSGLFRAAGYFPVYDLVTEAFSVFRVFDLCGEEEATLVKILDVIRDFEGSGFNSLRDFLDFAGDEDNEDSAWNMDVPKNINAVKVMTVHKAKGLGFPAAIMLLYRGRNPSCDYIGEMDGDRMRLLKLTRDVCASEPDLKPAYDGAVARDWVNRLNSLYVGFTRAEEEMYVVGVKGERDKFPFDILPADESQALGRGRKHTPKQEQRPECRIIHHQGRIPHGRNVSDLINAGERRRGEFIHNVLAHIAFADHTAEDAVRQIIAKLKRETGEEYQESSIAVAVLSMLNHSVVGSYFRPVPGRRVMVEVDVSDAEGRLFRIDRLVIDEQAITVIDFKTGNDRGAEERYLDQMQNYLKIARSLFAPRTGTGLLAYLDLNRVKVVS